MAGTHRHVTRECGKRGSKSESDRGVDRIPVLLFSSPLSSLFLTLHPVCAGRLEGSARLELLRDVSVSARDVL